MTESIFTQLVSDLNLGLCSRVRFNWFSPFEWHIILPPPPHFRSNGFPEILLSKQNDIRRQSWATKTRFIFYFLFICCFFISVCTRQPQKYRSTNQTHVSIDYRFSFYTETPFSFFPFTVQLDFFDLNNNFCCSFFIHSIHGVYG